MFIDFFIKIEFKKVNKKFIIYVNNRLIIEMFAQIIIPYRKFNYRAQLLLISEIKLLSKRENK